MLNLFNHVDVLKTNRFGLIIEYAAHTTGSKKQQTHLFPMLFKTLESEYSINTLDAEAVQRGELTHSVLRRVLHVRRIDDILELV